MIIDKNFSSLMERCFHGELLSPEELQAFLRSMVDDTLSDVRIAAVLTALRFQPLREEHVLSVVEWCRQSAPQASCQGFGNLVDCGGTGTGNVDTKTVHISTMATILAAAAGAHVVKFAGKSFSSKQGSSSFLKFLGITPVAQAHEIETSLQSFGIAFLEAGTFYPEFKELGPIRKTLGFKTVVDLILPLINPVALHGQVLGVYQRDLIHFMASCLRSLGRQRALVVHAEDGLDEISIAGKTYVARLDEGVLDQDVWQPSDFGLQSYPLSELRAVNLEHSAHMWISLLRKAASPALYNAVVLNAAAVAWCAGLAPTVPEALALVRATLDSGKALHVFQNWQKHECD